MVIPFFRKKYILFVLILGLVLRLVILDQSLWLDEAIGAIAVRDYSYTGILTDFIKADNHSPLYYLMLKAWTGVFGYSEVALRIPSVIFGVGTVWFVYLIAKLLSSKIKWKMVNGKRKIPEVAALLLATSGLHIYYSQEARMYPMAAFLATAAFYFFLRLFKDLVGWKNWVLFSISITLLVLTDYVPVFLLPVYWIFALMKKRDTKFWKFFILTHLPLLILGILWLPTFLIQAERGKWLLQTWPGWRSVAGGATLKQLILVWTKFVFGRISLSNKFLYYSLVGLASIPVCVAFYYSWKNRNKSLTGIWMWLVIPIVLGFIVSFNFPAFIYFRFVYVLPAFYLLISWGIAKITNVKIRRALILAILASNILSWLIYITDVNQQRERWREATEFVENTAKRNEIVIFDYPEPITPYRWYSKGLVEAKGATDSISANLGPTKERTSSLIRDKSGIFYFEYLRDISDPNRYVENTLHEQGFVIKEVYNFNGVGQIFHFVR